MRDAINQHAPAAPSAAGVWVNCPGYLRLTQEVEPVPEHPDKNDEYNDASRLGTAAHWFADKALRAAIQPWKPPIPPIVGDESPAGVVLDDDMLLAVMIYIEHCKDIHTNTPGQHFGVEETAGPSQRFGPQCYGTPDFYKFDWSVGTLHVRDFKYGLLHVDAFENWQEVVYAGLLCDDPATDDIEQFALGIIQPRSFTGDTERVWSVTRSKLEPMWDRVRAALDAAFGSDATPECRTGPYCRMCPCRLACPAYRHDVSHGVSFAASSHPHPVDKEHVGVEYFNVTKAIEILKGYADALECAILDHHKRTGEKPSVCEVVRGRGRTNWREGVSAEWLAGVIEQATKKDVRKPVQIRTPKQCKDMGVHPSVVDSLTEETAGKLTIKPSVTAMSRMLFDK